MTELSLNSTHVGDAGASALAAALGRGALPRLKRLALPKTAIGDAGLVALAPALRRRHALEALGLEKCPVGDEGLAALVAPPPPAGAPPAGAPQPTTAVLPNLMELDLSDNTEITDAGCAHLASRLRSGELPALDVLYLAGTSTSDAAVDAVYEARPDLHWSWGEAMDDGV